MRLSVSWLEKLFSGTIAVMTIRFSIKGNQEDKLGNPIPYHRTTQGSYWNDASRRYKAWKDYVVKASGIKSLGKPIEIPKGTKAYMHLKIYFANNKHSDSDNIFKGIADALFVNDKKLAGSFDFDTAKEGRVDVEIILN